MGLHPQDLEQIMPAPPASEALAKDVDGNRKYRKEDRNTAKDIHDLLGTIARNPGVCIVRQAVEHEVLPKSNMSEDVS